MSNSSQIGRVARLWRYPIKSMGGELVDEIALTSRGVVGDRVYAVRTADGKLGSGKQTRRFGRVDGMLTFVAHTAADGPVLITLPEGTRVPADATETHARLSAALGQPITLVRESATSHFDAGAVHLVSEASIAWLRAHQPDVTTDERRLRPNIVFDVGDQPLTEDAWIGRQLQLGAARLRIVERTKRCVMVGLAQAALEPAPEALRYLTQHNSACLGVYADVLEPGPVRVGDELTLLGAGR